MPSGRERTFSQFVSHVAAIPIFAEFLETSPLSALEEARRGVQLPSRIWPQDLPSIAGVRTVLGGAA